METKKDIKLEDRIKLNKFLEQHSLTYVQKVNMSFLVDMGDLDIIIVEDMSNVMNVKMRINMILCRQVWVDIAILIKPLSI